MASSLCGAGWFGERCQSRNAVLALVKGARVDEIPLPEPDEKKSATAP